MEREIRSIGGVGLPQIEERTISGYAIVFDSESNPLYDRHTKRQFIEIIDRGAVSEELLKTSDVKALFNHDRDKLLARSVHGEGTLTLTTDEVGLRYEFVLPHTSVGKDVKELVSRGDLRGSSFAFTIAPEDVEESFDEVRNLTIRRVKRLRGLYDVSIVVDPAYQETSVALRSLDEKEELYGKGDTLTEKAVNIIIG